VRVDEFQQVHDVLLACSVGGLMTTSEPIDPHLAALDETADADPEVAEEVLAAESTTRTFAAPTTLAARRHPLAQPAIAASFDGELDDDDVDDDDDDVDFDNVDDEHESGVTSGASNEHGVVVGPRLSLVTPSTLREQQELSAQIDRLSLEQALLDVEVANARVLDLTARLVEANQRIATLSGDIDVLRHEAVQVKVVAEVEVAAVRDEMVAQQAHLDAQRSSTAFRWAAKVWNLRNAIKS
jgi:hypothetical protein